MPETFGSGEAGEIIQPCALGKEPKPKPVHWIEIELVGEDGSPIPWFEYEVTLPDGSLVRGYLDEDGRARVENIENPGTAQVSFITLDQEAWRPASAGS